MKAEDLMIGDWIIRRGVPEEPMRLYDMKASVGIAYLDQDGRGVTEKFENIEPIPLTSEILEKNGFKRLQDTYLFNITTNQFGVNLWLEIGPDSWIENNKIYIDSLKGDFNYPMLTMTTCKYVHEFQHLLKLYEIKKDIVL